MRYFKNILQYGDKGKDACEDPFKSTRREAEASTEESTTENNVQTRNNESINAGCVWALVMVKTLNHQGTNYRSYRSPPFPSFPPYLGRPVATALPCSRAG